MDELVFPRACWTLPGVFVSVFLKIVVFSLPLPFGWEESGSEGVWKVLSFFAPEF